MLEVLAVLAVLAGAFAATIRWRASHFSHRKWGARSAVGGVALDRSGEVRGDVGGHEVEVIEVGQIEHLQVDACSTGVGPPP